LNSTLQHIILYSIALLLAASIFLADYYSPPSLAIGALYAIVVLYSWLLSGRWILPITGLICSLLIVISGFTSPTVAESEPLSGINQLIALVSVWVSVTLIAMAKRSFNELDQIIGNQQAEIEKKTNKLVKLNLSLEAQVQDRTGKLKRKNEELSQFAYVTSHDLKEPVNTVNGFIKLLLKEKSELLDDEAKLYLNHIQSSSSRMGELIRDLLEYSRIGRRDQLQAVNCHDLIDQIKVDLKATINQHKAELIVTKLPKLMAYPLELRLLFQNLISNAIKFRKKNQSPKIRIVAKESEFNWQFSIEDNGIGIEQKYQDRIFTIFKRLHPTEVYDGTGIGLAHCKKIVELHQGKIWLESELNKGSTFFFTLSKSIK